MSYAQRSSTTGADHRTRPARMAMVVVSALAALLLVGLPHCGSETALLLTIRAQPSTRTFDLQVKDLTTGKVVLNRKSEPIKAGVSPSSGIKVAVDFQTPGAYLVYIRGDGASQRQFFVKRYQIDGVVEDTVDLVPLPTSQDADSDGYPACGAFASRCPPMSCDYLDCNDKDATVHPFADEVCGDGKDNDCSGGCSGKPAAGDVACKDHDNDGVPSNKDCDDNDPCRSPRHQEAGNFCTTAKSAFKPLSKACLDKLKAAGRSMTAPYCGDGVDQDCDGKDVACQVDKDCDGFSPPRDCDDNNKAIHPGAREMCDGKDNNCDHRVDEGCIPCDVDGDGYASPAAKGDPHCTVPKTDNDDYDSGVNPGTTKDTGGLEGGTVKGALRQFCSYKETKNSTPGHKIMQRDVDHDGDGIAARVDGCPKAACDRDGDGFMATVPSAGCFPSKSQEDCNDNDPTIFPGAPDKCGDNKAQNCITDKACASIKDHDGDGYAAGEDCDDNNKMIHPWATEICDKVDNDCDGLTDEGNPDNHGTLIATSHKLCNDYNTGLCAPACDPTKDVNCSPAGHKLSGICACSPQKPTGDRHATARVTCSGENLGAPASQRCFGAIPRATEACDTKDHDCDGKAFVSGQDFVDKGKACGTAKGECKVGKVTDCDLSKQVAHYALVKKVDTDFNAHWVCSGKLPWPEVCNGRDDDCDGIFESYDKDKDKDGHLYCPNGCSYLQARYQLDTSKFKSCNDCDDNDAAKNPTAKEMCNGVDDNCKDGVSDDGKDECPPKGTVCCTTQKACINTKTSINNCDGCGLLCSSDVADKCVAGKCVCGNTGAACANGLNCVGGTCKCISGKASRCDGCCDSAGTCRKRGTSSQTATLCGLKGATCAACGDGKDCTTDTCVSGKCAHKAVTAGTACKGGAGTCIGDACCTGCNAGSTCQAGTTARYCGAKGATCAPCKATGQCTMASCSTGTCVVTDVKAGTSCNDTFFCTTGDACVAGKCVGKARTCANNGVCNETLNTCETTPKTGTVVCKVGSKTGQCSGGKCCTGCFDTLGTCQPGVSRKLCGKDGGLCKVCPAPSTCKVMTCASGACVEVNAVDGVGCTAAGGKSGSCVSGVCCTGCVGSGGACLAGNTVAGCGAGGLPCQVCTSSAPCKDPSCAAGSCTTVDRTASATCVDGTNHAGRCYTYIPVGQSSAGIHCCTGCWDGTACDDGTGTPQCGKAGASCVLCGTGTGHVGPGTCTAGTCDCTAGCWDATTGACMTGNTAADCGTGGATCATCAGSTPSCSSGTCQ